MSCCGRGTTTPGGTASGPPRRLDGRRGRRPGPVTYLQYTGETRLTARGPLSGRSYRFASPGAILSVDPRDLRSLEAIPRLRRVDGRRPRR